MKWEIGLLLMAALLVAASAAAQKKDLDLEIAAPDGAKLKATYFSPGKPGPGMLLLHQCNMDRKSWKNLAAALAQRGIHVLTFDYRGYGESAATGGRQNLAADINAAFATLVFQPGVDKNRLAAGGASCGVNNSIHLARRSGGQIKALMLLSGPTMRELNNAGHGAPMFDADSTLLPAVADWLAKVLR